MDENFLLTIETLTRNRAVESGAPLRGVQALRARGSSHGLIVNAAQRAVLDEFVQPQTVPQMLGRAIQNRTCLELSECYELILKAHRAGVLVSGAANESPTPRPPVRRRLPWTVPVVIGVAAVLGVVTAILIHPPTTTVDGWQLALGWLAWAAAWSAGALFAAATLRGGGGEPGAWRMEWRTPVPHAVADLRDACLRTVPVRAAVAVARVAPLAVVTAVGLFSAEAWALPPLAGLLWSLRPWMGPVEELLELVRARPRIDTERAFLFSGNRTARRRLKTFWRRVDRASAGLRLGYGVCWAVVVALALYDVLNVPLKALPAEPRYWLWAWWGIGGGMAAAALGVTLWWCLLGVLNRARLRLAKLRRLRWRWQSPKAPAPAHSEVLQVMSHSPLFRSIGGRAQAIVAESFELLREKAWTPLAGAGGSDTNVGLIVRGEIVVKRFNAEGRAVATHALKEADVFGPLLELSPGGRIEVRTRTPVMALMLPLRVFNEQFGLMLGPERVHRLAFVCGFLRSQPLCENWQLSSILRLAELSREQSFAAGETIIAYAQDPQQFFVIYEGAVKVNKAGREVARLRVGDFFGEAGLLQNSAATADVIALEPTRCLCVRRHEFVRFVTHNHYVAMDLERIASRRLGRKIFPLQSSFDVR